MPSRRQVLAASSLALVASAGCLGDATPGGSTDAAAGDEETNGTATQASDAGTETTDGAAAEGADRLRIAVTDGDGERDLATDADVATVGDVEQSRQGGYQVVVALTDEATDAFADGLDAAGALDDPGDHEIRTYLDGERVYTAMLGRDLAAAMENGEWDGNLLVHCEDEERAEELRDALGGE